MRRRRRWLLQIAGLIVLLAGVVAILPHLVDTSGYRRQLEVEASSRLGMAVAITGPLQFRLLPDVQVTLHDVHITSAGQDVVTFDSLAIGFDLLALLRREPAIRHVVLNAPVISLARDTTGRFNFAPPARAPGGVAALELDRLAVVNGTVRYDDAFADVRYEARACNLEVQDLSLAAGGREDLFRRLDLTAELACSELLRDAFVVHEPGVAITGSAGKYGIDTVSMELFGGTGTGALTADFTGSEPRFELRFALPQLRSETIINTMTAEERLTGNLDFTAQLTLQGSDAGALKQGMTGELALHGEDLVLHGIALDEELARYESTRNFNIVDMGALFFAGPLGLVVTKGYDYANLLAANGSSSEISTLVSEWSVTNGVAQARDVAMATAANRIALKGSLDFNTGEFVGMTMALVDANGCARVEQAIHGTFRDPVIETPGILQSLARPALSLVERGLQLLPEEACEPFYTGALPAPQ